MVGENGTGKSTLLEAIAVAYGFNAEGGTEISTFPPTKPTQTCIDISTLTARISQGWFLSES